MTESIVAVIAVLASLFLVTRSSRLRDLAPAKTLKMVAVWIAIIALFFLLFSIVQPS